MSTDRDETYTIIVKEKPLASIKADLIQAFLSVRYILVHFFKETLLPRWLTNAYVKSSICKVMGFSAQNILALLGVNMTGKKSQDSECSSRVMTENRAHCSPLEKKLISQLLS